MTSSSAPSRVLLALGDVHLAEDVVQDVLQRLWNTRHRAVDVIRTSERRCTRELASPLSVAGGDDGNVAAHISQQAEHPRVLSALDLLPTKERRALRLACFGELTQVPISEVPAVFLGTVKTWCRRGKKRLAILLDDVAES